VNVGDTADERNKRHSAALRASQPYLMEGHSGRAERAVQRQTATAVGSGVSKNVDGIIKKLRFYQPQAHPVGALGLHVHNFEAVE
jgi:hypothetical protein